MLCGSEFTYVLIVYDIGVERVTKVYKLLKRYLHWVQNSVFEGELTDAQIENVKNRLRAIMDRELDGILFYIARDEKWLRRESLGQEKSSTDNII